MKPAAVPSPPAVKESMWLPPSSEKALVVVIGNTATEVTDGKQISRLVEHAQHFTSLAIVGNLGKFFVGGKRFVPGEPYAGMLLGIAFVRDGESFKAISQECYGLWTPSDDKARPKVFERVNLLSGQRSTDMSLAEFLDHRIKIQEHRAWTDTSIVVRPNGLQDYAVARFANPRSAPFDEVLSGLLDKSGAFELGIAEAWDRYPGKIRAGAYKLEWFSSVCAGRCLFWSFPRGGFIPSELTTYLGPYDRGLERMSGSMTVRLGSGPLDMKEASLSLDEAFVVYNEGVVNKQDRRPISVEVNGMAYSSHTSTHVGGTVGYHLLKERLHRQERVAVVFPFGSEFRSRHQKAFDFSAVVNDSIDCHAVRCTWMRTHDGTYRDIRTEYLCRFDDDALHAMLWRDEKGHLYSPLSPRELLAFAEQCTRDAPECFSVLLPATDVAPEQTYSLSTTIGKTDFCQPLKVAFANIPICQIVRSVPPSGSMFMAVIEFDKDFGDIAEGSERRLQATLQYGVVTDWVLFDGKGAVLRRSESTFEPPVVPARGANLVIVSHASVLSDRFRGASYDQLVAGLRGNAIRTGIAATSDALTSRIVLASPEKPFAMELFPEDSFRLLVPRLSTAEQWNEAAPLFREVYRRLPSYLFAGALVGFIEDQIALRLLPSRPRVLSVGAGFGDISLVLHDTNSRSMEVTDLDWAEQLLELSTADHKLHRDFLRDGVEGRYDVVYCSSLHRFSDVPAAVSALANATTALLVLKAEKQLFTPTIKEWFSSNGFVLSSPLNGHFTLESGEDVEAGNSKRSRDALKMCTFVSVRRVAPGSVTPLHGTVMVPRRTGSELTAVGHLLRELNSKSCGDVVDVAQCALQLIQGIDPAALGLNHPGIWSVSRSFLRPHVPSTIAPYDVAAPSLEMLRTLADRLARDGEGFAADDPDPPLAYNRLCQALVQWTSRGFAALEEQPLAG